MAESLTPAKAKTKRFKANLDFVLYSEGGDPISVDADGCYIPKSEADQAQLEYHASNGLIEAVGE